MCCLLLAACSSPGLPPGPNFTLKPDGSTATVHEGKAPETALLVYPVGRNGTPALKLTSYALDYFTPAGVRLADLSVPETPLPREVYVPSVSSVAPAPVRVVLPLVSAAVLGYGKSLSCEVGLKGATDQNYEVNLTTHVAIVFP